ncbi:MAG: hypothetical protein HDS36_03425 [Bacteroides sp.]|nr:hypothetical protein [Bacteroides sp.]
MLKRSLFVSVILFGLLTVNAEKRKINIQGAPKKQTSNKVQRAPMAIVVEAVYDSDTMTIEVSCSSPLEGEVFVYDASDILEDYAPCLNSILSVTNSDYHTIVIEGDDWIATGVIE